MKKTENKIMLIVYPDSLGENLKELEQIIKDYFQEAIGGLHILPFFHPQQTEDLHLKRMRR